MMCSFRLGEGEHRPPSGGRCRWGHFSQVSHWLSRCRSFPNTQHLTHLTHVGNARGTKKPPAEPPGGLRCDHAAATKGAKDPTDGARSGQSSLRLTLPFPVATLVPRHPPNFRTPWI